MILKWLNYNNNGASYNKVDEMKQAQLYKLSGISRPLTLLMKMCSFIVSNSKNIKMWHMFVKTCV